jgi:hypothetical protein
MGGFVTLNLRKKVHVYFLKPNVSPKWFVWSGSVTVLLANKDSLDVVSPAYLASAPDLAHTYLPLVFGRLSLRTAYMW